MAVHHSSKSVEWATPQAFFDNLLPYNADVLPNDRIACGGYTYSVTATDRAGKTQLVISNAQGDKQTLLPPSGDRHDYMSVAPYFWPNPNTSSELPVYPSVAAALSIVAW